MSTLSGVVIDSGIGVVIFIFGAVSAEAQVSPASSSDAGGAKQSRAVHWSILHGCATVRSKPDLSRMPRHLFGPATEVRKAGSITTRLRCEDAASVPRSVRICISAAPSDYFTSSISLMRQLLSKNGSSGL